MEAPEDPAHSGAVLAICNTDLINANSQVIYRRRVRYRAGLVNGRQLIRHCVRSRTNLLGEPTAGFIEVELIVCSVFPSELIALGVCDRNKLI